MAKVHRIAGKRSGTKQQAAKCYHSAQGGGDIQAILLTIIANRLAGRMTRAKTVKPGVDKLVELAPAVQTWEPKSDAYTLVANGTATLSIGYNARAQFYFDQRPAESFSR